MPSPKKIKKTSISKKTAVKAEKPSNKSKQKKKRSVKKNVPKVETTLSWQVPEDKYIQAQTQAALKAEQEAASKERQKVSLKNIEKEIIKPAAKPSRLHLWLFVILAFLVIFISWLFFWQYQIKMNRGNSFIPHVNQETDFWSNLFMINGTEQIESDLQKLEKAANQNKNINSIVSNPQNLSAEELDKIEEEIFPKLKE